MPAKVSAALSAFSNYAILLRLIRKIVCDGCSWRRYIVFLITMRGLFPVSCKLMDIQLEVGSLLRKLLGSSRNSQPINRNGSCSAGLLIVKETLN
jgi:hypothetical protein